MSLAVARLSEYNATFPAAGYADIVSNSTYVGGQVRQYGNLSFSRIYDAGHTVPSYQPETAFTVFTRIIQGDDIGMGKDVDLATFGTQGPSLSNHANKGTPQPLSTCWIRAINDTCYQEEMAAINAGLGVVRNGIWLSDDKDTPSSPSGIPSANNPTASAKDGSPTTTSSIAWTGVYTATATPKVTSGASSVRFRAQLPLRRQVVPGYDNHDRKCGGKKGKVRTAVIAGLASVGGVLLL